MLKWLQNNPMITLISLLIGLAGLTVGIYSISLSIQKRSPSFLADPDRTEIIKQERITNAPIKILRTNDEQIIGDITSVKLYFWNKGKMPIERKDILAPLKITLNDPQGEILDYSLQVISREVTNIKIIRSLEEPKLALSVDFDILEHNDGFCLQVIYLGNPTAKFNFSGEIKGVSTSIKKQQARF